MGPTKLCINVSWQTWALVLPPKRNFHTFLGLITALSFYKNHVNTTKTLRKRQKLKCKGFTYKDFKYTPVYWDKCQAKSGKLMFMANYTIVDWGPRVCLSFFLSLSLSLSFSYHWLQTTRFWSIKGPQHCSILGSLSFPISCICSNSCPLSQWYHPTISSSLVSSPPALNLSQHQGLFQQLSLYKVI